MMRKISLATLFLCCCVLSASAQTQSAPTTSGPVWRVVLYKVKPGKLAEVMTDMRQNLRPVYEECKKQGFMVDYKVYNNITKDSPEDWDLAIAVGLKNWTAFEEFGQKATPILLKHYGTREKMQEAEDKSNQLMEVVSVKLMRERTLNPLP